MLAVSGGGWVAGGAVALIIWILIALWPGRVARRNVLWSLLKRMGDRATDRAGRAAGAP